MFQLILVSALFAQYDPINPAEIKPFNDPRARRAAREACVARTGIVCRSLVENHGETAVAALNNCSPEVGRKLAACYSDGKLATLPGTKEFLLTVAKKGHGDIVAVWAIKHLDELADADAFKAYVAEPLEYALELKALGTGASEMKARRPAVTPVAPIGPAIEPRQVTTDWRNMTLIAVVVITAGVLVFYNRRRRQPKEVV